MNIETPQGRKLDVADVSTLSLRDMYGQICKNRDFEISLVWQRAIFLTAFLLGCFTAYGSVASTLFSKNCVWRPTSGINTICFLITLVGIVISLLWIMMAKGSKAWYELYECAIKAFVVRYPTLCDPELVPVAQNEWRTLIGRVKANNASIKECKRSRWFFSSGGGAYSVSRVNIFIGQFAFGIWFLLALSHIGVARMLSTEPTCELLENLSKILTNPMWMLVILCCIVVGVCLYGFFVLKSAYLGDK